MHKKTLLALLLTAITTTSVAGPLSTGYGMAQQTDSTFQGATGEKDANDAAAYEAAAAYFPRLNFSRSQLTTETATRNTTTVTQPLIDPAKMTTVLGYSSKATIAEAAFQTREQDLASRYFKAVSESIRAEESLSLNAAKIEALGLQFKAAQRMLELGVGTVSDVRDTQLQLQKAQADNLNLVAQRDAALRQVKVIIGKKPEPGELHLNADIRSAGELDIEAILKAANEKNPQLASARSSQRLAELDSIRAKAALLPTVEASYTKTSYNGVSSNYSGITVSFPLETSTFLNIANANGSAVKQRYQTMDTEEKTSLESQRLFDLVKAGESEMEIRKSAIRTAELSVEANEKSFRGGVRSKTDVLNSIQAMFQAKLDFVDTKLGYAGNLLSLRLLMAIPPEKIMQELDGLLF